MKQTNSIQNQAKNVEYDFTDVKLKEAVVRLMRESGLWACWRRFEQQVEKALSRCGGGVEHIVAGVCC